MLTWKVWLFNLSTLRTAQSGNVNPLPLGPPPCVCPVNNNDVDVLALWAKLLGVVEKHMNASDMCSLPA